jgi:hypothetical protein
MLRRFRWTVSGTGCKGTLKFFKSAKEFFEFVALYSFCHPHPVELGVQKYGASAAPTTGGLLLS